MSESELKILRESQAMLDETLAMLDQQMARVVGMSGPNGALAAEHWFRAEIRKALEPMAARIEQLENKPAPTATPMQPSRRWEENLFRSIGEHIKDEMKKRDERIDALENKIANWKYCGVWSAGNKYAAGNFTTQEGSLFVCLWDTEARPGTDSSWQLCCKRGKDGKDGRDGAENVRRLPTMQRG